MVGREAVSRLNGCRDGTRGGLGRPDGQSSLIPRKGRPGRADRLRAGFMRSAGKLPPMRLLHKTRRRLAAVGLAAVAAVASIQTGALAAEALGDIRSAGGPTAVAGSYIVVLKDGTAV